MKREINDQVLLQLNDEDEGNEPEFVEYTIPNDQQEILEEVFSEKKEQSQHEKFKQRILERENAAIDKKTNHAHSYPVIESFVEEKESNMESNTQQQQSHEQISRPV